MSRRQFIRLLGCGTVAVATFSLGGCVSSDLPSQAVEECKGPQANESEPRRGIDQLITKA